MSTLHEDICPFMIFFTAFFLECEIYQTQFVENIKTHVLSNSAPPQTPYRYEIMSKGVVQPDMPQVTV